MTNDRTFTFSKINLCFLVSFIYLCCCFYLCIHMLKLSSSTFKFKIFKQSLINTITPNYMDKI